eukprot:c21681_g1_i1 orf=138-2138(-)
MMHLVLPTISLCLSCLQVAAYQQTVFGYNGFEDATNISFFQGSSIVDGSIQLTKTGVVYGNGRVLFSHPVQFRDSPSEQRNSSILSFSTQFIFTIDPGVEGLADGIAFVIAPNKSAVENSFQGYLGVFNATTDGSPSSHTFAVEMDTYKNPEDKDIDDNHVGVDINSVISYTVVSAAVLRTQQFRNASDGYAINLKSGLKIQAWIDYDASTTQLNISVSRQLGQKPPVPLLSNNSVDLSTVLKDYMYIGFSASTGPLDDVLYYLHAWSFSNNGTSPPIEISGSAKHRIPTFVIVPVTLCGVGLFILSLVAFILIKRRDRNNNFEWKTGLLPLDNMPHTFTYKDLSKATRGFHKQQMLGCGGFGYVYRGVLPGTGIDIAVKRISKESKQGPKEFIAEISSIGHLRHRNLVPLLGWCYDRDLLLVYEYMPNGSLDKFLFSEDARELTWALRVKILTGVAASLVYLHEEWEQKIIHRDVKASNVMLDADFNARLGDFGLARQYEHSVLPGTTNVAGTWGYLAPEYCATRQATDKTDVFSFGALTLEVVTGKRITEYVGGQHSLVEWLWQLQERDGLLEAADPRLKQDYDPDQMNRIFQLGLNCSHPYANSRPSMREVSQILKGAAALPGVAAGKVPGTLRISDKALFDSMAEEQSTSFSSTLFSSRSIS